MRVGKLHVLIVFFGMIVINQYVKKTNYNEVYWYLCNVNVREHIFQDAKGVTRMKCLAIFPHDNHNFRENNHSGWFTACNILRIPIINHSLVRPSADKANVNWLSQWKHTLQRIMTGDRTHFVPIYPFPPGCFNNNLQLINHHCMVFKLLPASVITSSTGNWRILSSWDSVLCVYMYIFSFDQRFICLLPTELVQCSARSRRSRWTVQFNYEVHHRSPAATGVTRVVYSRDTGEHDTGGAVEVELGLPISSKSTQLCGKRTVATCDGNWSAKLVLINHIITQSFAPRAYAGYWLHW